MRIFGAILFPFFINIGFAQVSKEDFAKINKVYISHPQLYFKAKYDLYKNQNIKETFESEMGETKRNGNLLYTKIGKIESIHSEKYNVIVDNEDKTISLLAHDPDENGFDEKLYMINLEKTLKLCTKVEFAKEIGSQNSYLLTLPYSEYSQVKITYNKKTFFIEKITLYYKKEQVLNEQDKNEKKEQPRVEITYYDFDETPHFNETDFSYDKFLEKANGKFRCKSTYSGYTLKNLL